MKTHFLALFLGIAVLGGAVAQDQTADFERATRLRRRTANLVDRAEIKPVWLTNGNFWYRVQTGAATHEFILVDPASGHRAPAFDHTRLANALSVAAGQKFSADQLPLSQLEFADRTNVVFSVGGKFWSCQLSDYSLRAITNAAASQTQLRRWPRPRPSRRTGEETRILFLNQTAELVKLFWIDSAGERQFYASIPAGASHEQHTYAGHIWMATTGAGSQLAVFEAGPEPAEALISTNPASVPEKSQSKRERGEEGVDSPDGRWQALIRSHNLILRDRASGAERQLSTNGTRDDFFAGPIYWSPDSRRLVVLQTQKGETRTVHLVESSPRDQLQPRLLSFDYNKPGDRMPVARPRLFDVLGGTNIPIAETLFTNAWSITDLHWWPDSSQFSFLFNQRGHQVLRVVGVDAGSGAARAVVEEASPTFIDYSGKFFLHELNATGELIWMSERDGWNHLYLYDVAAGRVKNQITHGDWVVRAVDFVDVTNRQVWFRAGGVRPGLDPYQVHYCRVNFDGSGLVVLTAGDGTHEVDFSPDRRWFVDSWSRVDAPPVTELRRSADGQLVVELERADPQRLLDTGWKLPERSVAKARDGVTDIHGVIFRPTHFDPRRKYPVVENIYAGPQGSFTPRAFKPFHPQQEIAELGFIVVQLDGMGTSHRSKKFHDVCWKNLTDAGFPDRRLWITAAAARHPEMDLSRVGIYGGSAGGQNAMRALLDHGDFYHVAVADCGCHDNRMDKIWWNEQWLGWPVDESYQRSSNVADAAKLQGKLLLIVGELDHNVDPASTMQVVNALEKADKDFELVVITGADHGAAETPYGKRRRAEFLMRHLLGAAPRH